MLKYSTLLQKFITNINDKIFSVNSLGYFYVICYFLIISSIFCMGINCINSQSVSPIKANHQFTLAGMINTINQRTISDDYQIKEVIGKGSYGEVFKAIHKQSGIVRAVKRLQRIHKKKIHKQAANQLDILKSTDHPHIMKVYSVYAGKKFLYIVMQLCKGIELFDYICQKSCLTEAETRFIIKQIASALQYLHSHGIMHRDLKLENLIYDSQQKTIKIIDFGHAVRFTSQQQQKFKKIVGTCSYMAPQVTSNIYNEKCDVWSLGVIMYFLLSGKHPFHGHDQIEIRRKVQQGYYGFQDKIWNTMTNSVKILLKKMLERNPKIRISIQDILKDSWFSLELSQDVPKQNVIEHETVRKYLNTLRKFKQIEKAPIQQGILIFIVNFIKKNENQNQMFKCFQEMDINSDGVLSEQQLSLGLAKYLSICKNEAQILSQKIFERVDINFSGFIDYSQFILAATNIQLSVSEQNLDLAFNYLDEDKNGELSMEEIRKKLGENITKDDYELMMTKFDNDKNKMISRDQFKMMMKGLIQNKRKQYEENIVQDTQ